MTGYFNHTLPLILGSDVSGTVVETGPATNGFRPGDPVYARVGVYRDGAYAQYALAAVTDVAARPKSIDILQAAALPHVTLTAWQALFEMAGLEAGQTVLIHGAAGGVGHIAVQLAKWKGARVIGTASHNFERLKSLPVDVAVNYATTPFESVAKDVDVVLDTIGGETQARSWSVLKPGGMLVSTIQAPSAEEAAAHGVRAGMVFSAPPIGKTLTELAGLVDSGIVRPHVSQVLPLHEIAKAHAMIEGRHTAGKIVIQVAQ